MGARLDSADLVKLRGQLANARGVVPFIAKTAAPTIALAMGEATITDRGNIGEFAGPMKGSVDDPIVVTPGADMVTVHAADWVMRKALAKGFDRTAVGIVSDVAESVLGKAFS